MSLWVGWEGKIPPGDYHDIAQSHCKSDQGKKAKLGSHGRRDKQDKETPFFASLQQ